MCQKWLIPVGLELSYRKFRYKFGSFFTMAKMEKWEDGGNPTPKSLLGSFLMLFGCFLIVSLNELYIPTFFVFWFCFILIKFLVSSSSNAHGIGQKMFPFRTEWIFFHCSMDGEEWQIITDSCKRWTLTLIWRMLELWIISVMQ